MCATFRWASGGKLFTASYDGSLRCLDPAAGNFELVVSAEEAEFSAFDCTPDGNVAILGDNDGYLHVFDVREKRGTQRGKEVELHNKRVNTLHVRIFVSCRHTIISEALHRITSCTCHCVAT